MHDGCSAAFSSGKEIVKRLQELDDLIRETKARLPAHSTKPPVMMDLLAYEDEYDLLLNRLNALKKAETHDPEEAGG